MRALLRGERTGTPLQVLTLLAVIGFASVALYLILHGLHGQARAQRQQTADERHYQQTEYHQCLARTASQAALRRLEEADVALQRRQIAIDRHNPVADPGVRTLRRAMWRRKLRADLAWLDTSPPPCRPLRPAGEN